MKLHWLLVGAVALTLAASSPAGGQDVPFQPCREVACALALEWTPPAYADRRYGNAGAFEGIVLEHLLEAGYAFVRGAEAHEGALTFVLRPRMTEAMCDQVAGTETSMNCRTIGEVRIASRNVGSGLDMRSSLVVRGRCGADQMMDVNRMGEYVAAMLVREFLAGEKGPKPSSRC